MQLVILIGLQGAGKTTFYRSHFAGTHVLVSKDQLRHNRRPERRQRELIGAALAEGRSVVVDNTNPARTDREPLIAIGREQGAQIVGYWFEPDLQACIRRNQERTGPDQVPEVALHVTLRRLEPPSLAEGFDRLYHVRCTDGGFEITEWQQT